MTFHDGDGSMISEPLSAVFLGRFIRCPEQNAGTISREEVHEFETLLDGPHERSVEPLLARWALRGHQHRPGMEHRDIRILTKVEQSRRCIAWFVSMLVVYFQVQQSLSCLCVTQSGIHPSALQSIRWQAFLESGVRPGLPNEQQCH